jgi:hypothetical protein
VGELVEAGEWTPQEAADYVRGAWQNAVESIVETGRRLEEAKKRVGHGRWLDAVDLMPFGERTARALMQISRHPDISNRQHVADLPASWGTLSILAQLPPGEIPRRIEAHEITAELERAKAQEIASTFMAARQESLNAYSEAVDGLTQVKQWQKEGLQHHSTQVLRFKRAGRDLESLKDEPDDLPWWSARAMLTGIELDDEDDE